MPEAIKCETRGARNKARALICLCSCLIALGIINAARVNSPTQSLNHSQIQASVNAKASPQLPLNARINPPRNQLNLSSDHFRASYPPALRQSEVAGALDILETARADLLSRAASASLQTTGPDTIEVVIHPTTADFIAATSQPSWAAAATLETRIELQPLAVLKRRGVLKTTLRHEYAHAFIETLGHGRAPRWLAEGMAADFAGEGSMLAHFDAKEKLTTDELEQRLSNVSSQPEMRALYAAAYRETLALIRVGGEARIWRRVAQS